MGRNLKQRFNNKNLMERSLFFFSAVLLLLLVLSIVFPTLRNTVVFSSMSTTKDISIGPLGSQRNISFEYDTNEQEVHKIIIPLQRVGKMKKNGSVICTIYENDQLVEKQKVSYNSLEKSRFNYNMNLNIEFKRALCGRIRVDICGKGLKSRVYIKGTNQIFSEFYSYQDDMQLSDNVMCEIIGVKEEHPYTWELVLLLVAFLMFYLMEKEKTNE